MKFLEPIATTFFSFITLVLMTGCAFVATTTANDQTQLAVALEYKQEISILEAHPKVQSALAHVVALEPRSQSDLIELTQIPAPPFAEEIRGRRFAELLREAGLTDVSIDAVGNVIGRRPGRTNSRVIAYTAHLDTVFPAGTDVTVRFDGGKMLAPGIGDNTRGLVVILTVLRALQHADIETEADILFVGNVGEEGLGDLRGVKHLLREGGPKIDVLIAVDGGNTNRIVYGGVGSHRYRVTYKGPGGHSWSAFGTASPHHALGRAIAAFVERASTTSKKGDKTSYNIGRIGGGTSINSIAFESWMEVDMRSGNPDKLDNIDALFQTAVTQALAEENAARLEGPELTVEVERVGNRPAVKGDPQSPLVQRAMAAMQIFDVEPELKISSTDANYPISIGVPAITLSRGGISEGAHSLGESWENKDGHVAIQISLLTVLSEAGLVQE